MKTMQQLANAFARKKGYSMATDIVVSDDNEYKIISSTSYGYRKRTTGEYVSKAYLNHFGWKNTYYQHAECVVAVPYEISSKVFIKMCFNPSTLNSILKYLKIQ